jgi:uncharacterized protein DUF4339
MKKYFIHDGTEQGPFDLDELRSKRITKETMVWYEGLDKWRKAGEIPELKDVLSISPPPFSQSTPPPYSATKSSVEPKKKKSTTKTIVGIIVAILIVIGGLVVYNILSNPKNNNFLQVTVNPPNPRIVYTHGDKDPKSDLFDYKYGIDAVVLNEGGDGNILVTCNLTQGQKTFERTKEVHAYQNQKNEIHFTFEEVEVLGANELKYNVFAKAIK